MNMNDGYIRRAAVGAALALTLAVATAASAQTGGNQTTPDQTKPSVTIYGFAMLDAGQNFKTINPNWFDTLRVTKLPSFEDQFGKNNSTFFGVRQSRLGVKTASPTSLGELKTTFEFELFGTGVDEGQTTFRLRHAYGELGKFGAGQTWSVFMDPDVFPNTLEYWGPTGMVFFRNVQVRYMPIQQAHQSLTVALERPGASGDAGVLADRIELQNQNIKGRNPAPDITGQYTRSCTWGYVRVAGAYRRIAWDDLLDDQLELSGHANGWGINVSSNLKPSKKDVIRLQLVYGHGIENYMNDAPVDVGIVPNPGNVVTPILGKALPVTGTVFFLDHSWNAKWTSSFGYSRTDIQNTIGQTPDAYKTGQYAIGNVLYSPAPNVMVGGEFQWGRRTNFSDGFSSDGVKVQFSFKYNFSYKVGG